MAPLPVCICARNLSTGVSYQHWLVGAQSTEPPFPFDPELDLLVAFSAQAELSIWLACGWSLPRYVLDLSVEFRVATNGALPPFAKRGLLSALRHYRLPGAALNDDLLKEEMHRVCMEGDPFKPGFTAVKQAELLDYCTADVGALASLLPVMSSELDVDRAVGVRGKFVIAIAKIEALGVPIDLAAWRLIKSKWVDVRFQTVYHAQSKYGDVFLPFRGSGTFNRRGFGKFLKRRGISWPRLPTGRLALDKDTFSDMVRVYPQLDFMRDARRMMGQNQKPNLTVGDDGRNRTSQWPFSTKTGRNQPNPTEFIFGLPAWMRSLIKPPEGMAVSYIDWSAAEFGIAAAMSGDLAMVEAYESGDPYLYFAIKAGAAPVGATKKTHEAIREIYKVVTLAVSYGMGIDSLAARLGIARIDAADLIQLHRTVFPLYWKWQDRVADTAKLTGAIRTRYGWKMQITQHSSSDRSIRNWPCQAVCGELLRLAVLLAHRRGIQICATVHDAMLIEAPIADIDRAVEITRAAMVQAGEILLGDQSLKLRTTADIIKFPDRFRDKRGVEMWEHVSSILGITW